MTATAQKMRAQRKATMKGVRQTGAALKTDSEAVKAFKADMKESQEKAKESKARAQFKDDTKWQDYSLISLAQRKEFLDWATDTIAKANQQGRRVDFIVDMKTKLIDGVELTDNMVAALRKWKERDVPKPVGSASPKEEVVMTVKIKKFLQGQLNLDSRVITGVVKQESAKAYLMEGHADMLETQSWCMRCGRPLTQPASYTIGFGEICADHMGVPYPGELNSMTGKERASYRKSILGTLHKQKFERWIPKSQIEEVLERKDSKKVPAKKTKKGRK